MPAKPATFKPPRVRAPATAYAAIQPRRRTTKERGYDADWKRLRKRFAREHPLCEHCRSEGRTAPGEHVDHRIPIAQRPDLRLDESNLQHLCAVHHGRKTVREQRGEIR